MTIEKIKELYNIYISNNEEILVKAKDAEDFLEYTLEGIIFNENFRDDEIKYFIQENDYLLEQIKEYNPDDYVCLYENAMSGYYMIDNSRIDEILEEMREKGETLK